jgi:hypothetical protein
MKLEKSRNAEYKKCAVLLSLLVGLSWNTLISWNQMKNSLKR